MVASSGRRASHGTGHAPTTRPSFVGDKIHKAAALAALGDTGQIYRQVIAQWAEPSRALRQTNEPSAVWDDPAIANDIADPSARTRYFDMMHYLPDDILTKVDRASMAVSLEARVPLLDHRVVEYSWRLPRAALIDLGLLWSSLGGYLLQARKVDRPAAALVLPYLGWVSFAAVLNAAVIRKNPRWLLAG